MSFNLDIAIVTGPNCYQYFDRKKHGTWEGLPLITPPEVPEMADSGLNWVDDTELEVEVDDESIFEVNEAIRGGNL